MMVTVSPGPAATRHPVLCEDAEGLSLLFEDGVVQSRMLLAEPARLALEYTRLMMGFLLLRPAPGRIAMIGLGGGSLARYCTARLPDAEVTAVEISPEVIALRDVFGVPADGARFRVLCEDGAAFVRRDGEALDAILVDAFDRTGQPERLCSLAFYDDCRARLAASGVLVVNLYSDDPACEDRIERIRVAFAGKLVVVRADDSANAVVFAGTDPAFPPAFGDLVQRLRALDVHHPVRLDRTLEKMLRHVEPRRPARDGRRRSARAR